MYATCYTTSYGMVFPAVLLVRVIPVNNAAVRGLIDGAQAVRQKADEIYPPGLRAQPENTPLVSIRFPPTHSLEVHGFGITTFKEMPLWNLIQPT